MLNQSKSLLDSTCCTVEPAECATADEPAQPRVTVSTSPVRAVTNIISSLIVSGSTAIVNWSPAVSVMPASSVAPVPDATVMLVVDELIALARVVSWLMDEYLRIVNLGYFLINGYNVRVPESGLAT